MHRNAKDHVCELGQRSVSEPSHEHLPQDIRSDKLTLAIPWDYGAYAFELRNNSKNKF
jgi:hypothetical protein